MKKIITLISALAAVLVLAQVAQAGPELKIVVVDISKVFDNHYETKQKQAELKSDQEKASDEIQHLIKQGNDLVDKYKELVDQSKNPALTPEARSKAQDDANKELDEIKSKQNDLESYKENAGRQLQQRYLNIRSVLIDEISKVASDVAKRHSATLLLDKSGQSIYGASIVLYADSAYDITDEVIKEVNKDHPISSSPSSSSAPAPSSSSDQLKFSVPGVAPSK